MGTGSTSRGITETDVWQAADALLLEGARPTIERVRQKVGRGSPNTVSPYLDTWFRKLGARIKDPMAFSAPPAVPDPVQQAATHFWESALASARALVVSELATERDALEADRRAATEEKVALAAERDRAALQAQAREDVTQALREQLAESARQVEGLRDQVREQAAELTSARDRAAHVAADCEVLRVQLEAARAAHEKARAEVEARTQAHEKRWTMEVDRAREALKTEQARNMKHEKSAATRLEKLARELEQAANEHKRAADVASKREAAHVAQIDRLQAQLSKALGQLESKDQEHKLLLRTWVGETKAKGSRIRPAPKRPSVARR